MLNPEQQSVAQTRYELQIRLIFRSAFLRELIFLSNVK